MTSYASAIKALAATAQKHSERLSRELIPLNQAIGHVVAEGIHSPVSTPRFDTSAMDGYAVSSQVTQNASLDQPLVLEVRGTIAAGDEPTHLDDCQVGTSTKPCFEIMTGGIFPSGSVLGRSLDACIRVEETAVVAERTKDRGRLIMITRPVVPHENRRLAGSDVKQGQVLLERGTVLLPQHLLVLVSIGITRVCVWKKPRVGLWSSGKEIASSSAARIPDANAPYLTTALREAGVDACFLGTLHDDNMDIVQSIQEEAGNGKYDIIVTTGGVSVGKYDLLAPALADLGATIEFHGLDIRPGHPILFGSLPVSASCSIPVFGLPGNPGAAAACFRFLVCPYLDFLLGKPNEKPIIAHLEGQSRDNQAKTFDRNRNKVLFQHGRLWQASGGAMVVELSKEQSPAKLGPYLKANCWVRFDNGNRAEGPNPLVSCYLFQGFAVLCR